MRLVPFPALRASQHHVTAVSCPPVDTIGEDQAAEIARAKSRSLISVLRHEALVGVVEGVRPSPAAHLAGLIEGGSMVRETEPWLYAYRLAAGGSKATGVIGRVLDPLPDGPAPEDPLEVRRSTHPKRIGATLELTRLVIDTWAPLIPRLLLDLNERPLYHFVEKETGVTHSVWSLRRPAPYCEYLEHRAWRIARTAHAGVGHDPVVACVFGADEWDAGGAPSLRMRAGLIGMEREVDD